VYAKTLIPGPHPIPALMATTADADTLMPQLTDRGWVRFGERLPAAAAGQVVIGADRLQLLVDGQALLDDLNPYAPDGWWSAVDTLHGRCVVVIVRNGDVDLAHHQAGEQLAALIGTGRAVSAALPVVTNLTDQTN
jgi:hypothetical protein